LRDIDIAVCDIGEQGIQALFVSLLMRNLRGVSLSGLLDREKREHGAGDRALQSLLAKPPCNKLEKLDFGRMLTDQGVEDLLRSAHVAVLRELRLHGFELTSRTLVALSECSFLSHLESIDLYMREFSADDVTILLGLISKTPLSALNLNHSGIDAEGFRLLSESSVLRKIKEFRDYEATDERIGILTSSPNIRNMRSLTLWSARQLMTDAGVISLATCPHLTELRSLNIRPGECSDEAAWALVNSPYLKHLKYLDFQGDHFLTEPALDALRQRFGNGFNAVRKKKVTLS
jgi:hypothetical protein